MKKARLRWFEHAKRKCVDVAIRRFERLVGTRVRRGRGNPKKILGGVRGD